MIIDQNDYRGGRGSRRTNHAAQINLFEFPAGRKLPGQKNRRPECPTASMLIPRRAPAIKKLPAPPGSTRMVNGRAGGGWLRPAALESSRPGQPPGHRWIQHASNYGFRSNDPLILMSGAPGKSISSGRVDGDPFFGNKLAQALQPAD
jgi:hypothetical protein